MKELSNERVKRMIDYAICIIIIHLLFNVKIIYGNLMPIDVMQELKNNILFSMAVSYLLTYRNFIRNIKKDKKTIILFGLEILILALTIDIKFMIFSELILIFVKSKENKQEDIINKNIKEYFKNKNK